MISLTSEYENIDYVLPRTVTSSRSCSHAIRRESFTIRAMSEFERDFAEKNRRRAQEILDKAARLR